MSLLKLCFFYPPTWKLKASFKRSERRPREDTRCLVCRPQSDNKRSRVTQLPSIMGYLVVHEGEETSFPRVNFINSSDCLKKTERVNFICCRVSHLWTRIHDCRGRSVGNWILPWSWRQRLQSWVNTVIRWEGVNPSLLPWRRLLSARRRRARKFTRYRQELAYHTQTAINRQTRAAPKSYPWLLDFLTAYRVIGYFQRKWFNFYLPS